MASSDLRPPKHKTTSKKKTRELPNLSDCHACERRTNNAIPSERLRILDSHWRIVLLCRSCYHLVESAKLCSYCLTETGESTSVHHCRRCHRLVHGDCVSRYSGLAPFSYLSSPDGFSICIDCWVPRLLDSKKIITVGTDSCSPGISRVSDVANDANCMVRRKSLIADVVREKAVDLVDLVSAGEEEDNKCSDYGCELVDCCDKKLAIQLHTTMNSSTSLNVSCAKSMEMLKLNYKFSAEDLSRLKLKALKPEEQIETSSIKLMNAGSENNSVNAESHSRDKKYVVVCALKHNGNFRPEYDRFGKKYCRRS